MPSQTELLHSMGLEEEVVGITKFCVRPDSWFRNKTRVGGTKNLHIDKIRGLQPDLIIANKEENVREQIEELAREFPVWISDVRNLNDATAMIRALGEVCGKSAPAEAIAAEIERKFDNLPKTTSPRRALYLIWRKPFMGVGPHTFIHDMLQQCGFTNVLADSQLHYPELGEEQMRALMPEIVLLSSEPYPFKPEHAAEIREILPDSEVLLVNAEPFSWYGSALLGSADYFEEIRKKISG